MRRNLFLGGWLVLLALAPAATARVPRPDPMPEIRYAPCPTVAEALGCTSDVRPVVIYLRDHAKLTRWHELGHVYDYQHMTPALRARWARVLRYPERGWREPVNSNLCAAAQLRREGDDACDTDAELFADSYMLCVARPKLRHRPEQGDTLGYYNYRPTARQHRRVCRLISRARQE